MFYAITVTRTDVYEGILDTQISSSSILRSLYCTKRSPRGQQADRPYARGQWQQLHDKTVNIIIIILSTGNRQLHTSMCSIRLAHNYRHSDRILDTYLLIERVTTVRSERTGVFWFDGVVHWLVSRLQCLKRFSIGN